MNWYWFISKINYMFWRVAAAHMIHVKQSVGKYESVCHALAHNKSCYEIVGFGWVENWHSSWNFNLLIHVIKLSNRVQTRSWYDIWIQLMIFRALDDLNRKKFSIDTWDRIFFFDEYTIIIRGWIVKTMKIGLKQPDNNNDSFHNWICMDSTKSTTVKF